MPPMVKKPCINNPNYTYSGKEATPLGLGYVAESEQVGHIMEGRDKTMWIVGIKNGIKVWNRVPTELSKEQPLMNKDDDEQKTPARKETKEPVETKEPGAPKKKPIETRKEHDAESSVKKNLDADFEKNEDAVEEAPKKKRAPAKKKEVAKEAVVVAEEKEVEAKPADEPPKKKRAPAKKKAVVKEAEAVADAEAEAEPKPEEPAPKKKRAPAKKKEVVEGEEAPAKKLTSYNIYMKYRLKKIVAERPDLTQQKDRLAACGKEWKALSKDEQAKVIEVAKAELGL